MTDDKPEPFLKVRVRRLLPDPAVLGACAGFEQGQWRLEQLADHLMEWLPEFALTESEWRTVSHSNAVSLLRRAAQAVYKSKKFENRGEFGELLLHALVRQEFDSTPAISKIYYKSAANDTVKGFDAVHVVGPPEDLELWLGEAKFYTNIDQAIRDVIAELREHLATDYLRGEFLLIKGKIDPASPHASALKVMLSPNTSLDTVFARACIPVLLTYDSECLAAHNSCTAAYERHFQEEIEKHAAAFATALSKMTLPQRLRVCVFLVPLRTKALLVAMLDRKLKTWQQL